MNLWKTAWPKHLLATTMLGLAVNGAVAQDCNNNGIPDDQELTETWVMTGQAPGRELAQFTFVDAPEALVDVPMRIEAQVLISFDEEQADIYVDGSFIGSIFDEDCGDFNCANPFRCAPVFGDPSARETIMIPASVWNNARVGNNGSVPVEVDYIQASTGGRCLNPRTLFRAEILTTTDCDGDGILNDCEVDCDNNGRPDDCQTDSDGDGVINQCDECEGSDDSIDDDQDGVIDGCDQCLGEDDRIDCNEDGIPDCTQRVQTWSINELTLDCGQTPGAGPGFYDPHTPIALSDVRVFNGTLPAFKFNQADQYYSVYLNGVEVGRLYEGVRTCDDQDEVLTIPAAVWNSHRRADATMSIAFVRSQASCDDAGTTCGATGFPPEFFIEYEFDADADGDGWLDMCAPRCNPAGPDSDADGVPDACDDCPDTIPGMTFVDSYGCPQVAVPADVDFDGDVDAEDFAGFFLCVGEPNVAPFGGCEAYDYGIDGDVDMHDFLALQDAASGTDVVAELGSMGSFVPHFAAVDRFLTSGFDMTWLQADQYCKQAYGTNLASIQGTDPNQHLALFAEMAAVMSHYPNEDAWFGLRSTGFQWIWADGSGELDGPTNWVNGGSSPTPGQVNQAQQYWAMLSSQDNHEWLNWADQPNVRTYLYNPQMFLCDLPAFAVGNEDHLAPVALDISIEVEGSNTVEILPGGFVAFEIVGQLDAATTQGLGGFAFNLETDGGGLFSIEPPAGDMQNFEYPAGYNPLGFEGKRIDNTRFLQIGGGQNTMGNTEIFGPTGTVITDVANTATVLATGRFIPPSQPGVYTVTLSNLVANTINPNQSGPVWKCEPALPGSNTGLTVTVIDCPDADGDGVCDSLDVCPDGNDRFDIDLDGVPNACDSEPMLRFEEVAPGTYSSYEEIGFIVETDTTFEIASEPNDGFDLQYLQTATSFTIRRIDGRPFALKNLNVSEVALSTGPSSWALETVDAAGNTSSGNLLIFTDVVNSVFFGSNEYVEVTYTSQTPGSVLRFDNHTLLSNCPGDINRDRVIDLTDLSVLLSDFGRSGAQASDINGDGSVDLSDLAQLLSLFGQSCD